MPVAFAGLGPCAWATSNPPDDFSQPRNDKIWDRPNGAPHAHVVRVEREVFDVLKALNEFWLSPPRTINE